MPAFDRPMDNPINWSLKVGRLFDIQIRLHLFFLFGAAYVVNQDVSFAREFNLPLSTALLHGLGTAAALFTIVLLHEFGHCFGARYVGGSADEILLWPLGGLASVQTPHRSSAHLITAAAGPAVNVVLMLLIGGVIAVGFGGLGGIPWNPFHPFSPVAAIRVEPGGAYSWLLVLFGINYVLFLFNVLLPIFPMDGGRIMQAIIWRFRGYRRSMEIATSVGMIGAIVLALFALFTDDTSVLLLSIAVFGYLECLRQRKILKYEAFSISGDYPDEFTFEFSAGEEPEPARRPGWWARRKARKLADLARRDRQAQEAREREFDRILIKIGRDGMASLTARERRLLEEETQRRRALTGDSPNSQH